ncbi:MAG TPA: methyltransferase domain-containing protein [Chloroflexota bacterium]|nr:methyltransferase domain-containing protein [Chloroflexota bacterium]
MPRIWVGEDEGRRALLQDGVILSVAVEGAEPPSGYWAAMLPHGSPSSALILGLGGGTLAHLLSRRYQGIQIVGIDTDVELIDFARREFDLDLPNLEVVIQDAFEYVAQCRRHFDYVAVDLFAGYDFQRGVVAKPFLRHLKEIVGPGGEITFNIFRDKRTETHLNRISRVLRIKQKLVVGRNVVVHCG